MEWTHEFRRSVRALWENGHIVDQVPIADGGGLEDEPTTETDDGEPSNDQNDGSAGSVAQADSVAVDDGRRDQPGVPNERPTPPATIAQYILDGLDRQSPEELRTIADYAERLAAWEE